MSIFETTIKKKYLKLTSKRLILLLVFSLLISTTAVAAPNISSVTLQTNKLSIVGSNFGLKPIPAPFYFSSLESEADGQIPSRQITNTNIWGTTRSNLSHSGAKSLEYNYCADAGSIVWSPTTTFAAGEIAKYNNIEYTVIANVGPSPTPPDLDAVNFRVGRPVARCARGTVKEDFMRNVIDLGPDGADKIFLSMWLYLDKGASTCKRNCQWKFIRIASNSDMYNIGTNQTTVLFDTWYNSAGNWFNTGNPHVYYWDGTSASAGTTSSAPSDSYLWNQWQRVDFYIQKSSASEALDGQVYFNRVGRSTPMVDKKNIPTYKTGNNPWRYVGLSHAIASVVDGYSELKVSLDDIYLDTTRSHVEICDTSTWAARTKCEIQPAASWDNDKIVVNSNQGRFEAGQTAYIYVSDLNGVVNSNGYPFIIGAAPPQPPQNVIETK